MISPTDNAASEEVDPNDGTSPSLSRRIDPKELFTPRRMDLVVKLLFFRALVDGRDTRVSESLYRKHIQARTGGVEPADHSNGLCSAKTRVDDYVAACHRLLASMQQHGFDSAQAIPVADHALANGAHRTACALALGLKVAVSPCPRPGPDWNFSWFVSHGFTHAELSLILNTWCELHAEQSSLFILWPAIQDHWGAVQSGLGQIFEPVGWLDFDFGKNRATFDSVVYDIYSYAEHAACLPHIDRKLAELSFFPARFRLVLGKNRKPAKDVFSEVSGTKHFIRNLMATRVPAEKFITCHAADNLGELSYLRAVLLDPRNTRWFPFRTAVSPAFQQWLESLRVELVKRGISTGDCCVVGSSSLNILGLRASTDVDFTITSTVRYAHFDSGITPLNGDVDVVTAGYHRTHAPAPAISDDELIGDPRHHFLFRGIKFANLNIVRDRKDFSRRPKDLIDVRLIEPFLESIRDQLALTSGY